VFELPRYLHPRTAGVVLAPSIMQVAYAVRPRLLAAGMHAPAPDTRHMTAHGEATG
jgi:hypothetical protein